MADSNDKLDEFLAAPEQVQKNEAELKKVRERKAKDAARKAREDAHKAKEQPSMEDMLADIVRVAEDEATNPQHAFRSISPRRYELYGHYPMEFLVKEFGQFNHALEIAGLRDQPGTRLLKARRANESRREHSDRYFARHVAPYTTLASDVRMQGDSYRILSISDLHGMQMDPFVWLTFLDAIKKLQPDCVVINGDALDLNQLSRHPKVPGYTPSLQLELDFLRSIFREIRKVHDGDLFDVAGNHDVSVRLSNYLTQVSPDLAGLRCLRYDELVGLGEHNVQIFHGGQLMSPEGTEHEKDGCLLFGSYRIHHGTKLGQTPAMAELKAAGRSGQSGHVHRASLFYGTTEAEEGLSWMTTPMAAQHAVGRHYIRGTTAGWQRGFGLATIFPNGRVHQYPVIVQASGGQEFICCEGFEWERPAWLGNPDPMTNWMDDERYQL